MGHLKENGTLRINIGHLKNKKSQTLKAKENGTFNEQEIETLNT